jgi:hypothetical protein
LDDTHYRGEEPLPPFVWRDVVRLILENRSTIFSTKAMSIVVRPKLSSGNALGADVQMDVPELKPQENIGMTFIDPAVSQLDLVDWWLEESPQIRSTPLPVERD